MKRNFKRFISLFMTLTLVLGVSIAEPKEVSAKTTDAVLDTTYTLTTTADSFYDVIEFTAPGTGEYAFSCEFIDEDNTWDGYGYLFDSSVDVYSKIDASNLEIADGVEYPRLDEYLVECDDSDENNLPYIEYELTKDEKYYFILGGYGNYSYGSAKVTITCLHSEIIINNRTITSCDTDGYTGDKHCAVCDKLLEEGQTIETHIPDNQIINAVAANCYVEGYTGDTVCSICETETKGTVAATTTHEYENNVCKHCGNIEYAKAGESYILETTEKLPYKVIGFKAPFTGEFEFYTENTDDNLWDGYGYLFVSSVNVDQKIKNGIADIPVNEDDTRLTGAINEEDDFDGKYMPVITYEMTKDEVCYFVMGGYGDEDYGEFEITINCNHLNTEIRNSTITSCTEGGYTGDTYCLDCNALISEGSDIPAGTEHSHSCEHYLNATCIDYTKYKYTCDACGDSYIEEDIESGYGDHNYVVTGYVAATCTKDGQSGTAMCEHCEDIKYENAVIKAYHTQTDADGYNPNFIYDANLKKQSCMIDGYTGDVICPHCGEVFEKGMNISATGHIFEDGYCTECDIEENILPLSTDGYYEIASADDLVLFMLNSHRSIKGKITKDIVTPDNFEYEEIPSCDADNSILDGGNHTISNWNLYETYYLFDSINDSTIKNLTIEVNMPEDNEKYGKFGVVALEAYNSIFENITINGVIIDTYDNDYQGGLVGKAENCKFIKCTNNADITVDGGNAGGIVGDGENLTFTDCVNNGDIHTEEDEVGGIAGQVYTSTFTNCKNTGKITTEDEQAGGIVGIAYEVTIDGCTNNGDVYSYEYSAGIIGEGISVKVEGCTNNGNITGEDYVAGIIGYGEMATVNNVFNTGKIGDGTGEGLVNGEDNVTISNSEASHTHKYDIQKVIKPATATTDGEAELVCKCGATNGKVVLKKTGSEDTTTKPSKEEPTTKVTKPGKTKIKSIKNVKTKKIKLTWKKIKGAKGYQVRYATNKKFKKAKIKTIKKNKTNVVLKKLKKKRYYVQVRAYKVSNGKKVVGKWSKRRTVKVKK